MKPLEGILSVYIAILLLVGFVPYLHASLQEATTDLPPVLGVLVLFVFDPTEYIWKWILLVVAVVSLAAMRST